MIVPPTQPGTLNTAHRHAGSALRPPRAPAQESQRARRHGGPTRPLTGDPLLHAVNDAMIALHQPYYHRAPASAKTQLIDDDVLACVMNGIYTDIEKH